MQFEALTVGGQTGATSGVLGTPSSTIWAAAEAGIRAEAAPIAASVISEEERFIDTIEHEPAAAVAPRVAAQTAATRFAGPLSSRWRGRIPL